MPFLQLTEDEFVDYVVEQCAAGEGGWVVTPNTDILRQCVDEDGVRTLLRDAVLVADGMPLIWASRLQGTPLPERVCGSNLISSITAAAAKKDLSLFLLGGADDTAERAKEILTARHPSLRVVGTYSPPFGFEKDEAELSRMEEMVRAAAPDIIFVALSFPKGERLTQRIRNARPKAWWIGVGISFSFLSGHVSRAPGWMQASGLEWMFRLIQEPGRLYKRYVVHDLPFAVRLFWQSRPGRR